MQHKLPEHLVEWNVYLVMGTGKPWAWQSSAKLAVLGSTNELVREAEEKLGAFEPIGSKDDR